MKVDLLVFFAIRIEGRTERRSGGKAERLSEKITSMQCGHNEFYLRRIAFHISFVPDRDEADVRAYRDRTSL